MLKLLLSKISNYYDKLVSKYPMIPLYLFFGWCMFKLLSYFFLALRSLDLLGSFNSLSLLAFRLCIVLVWFIYLFYKGHVFTKWIFNFSLFQYFICILYFITNFVLRFKYGIQFCISLVLSFFTFFKPEFIVLTFESQTFIFPSLDPFIFLLFLISFFYRFNKDVLIPALFSELECLFMVEKKYLCWEGLCLVLKYAIEFNQSIHLMIVHKQINLFNYTFVLENKVNSFFSGLVLNFYPLSLVQVNDIFDVFAQTRLDLEKLHEAVDKEQIEDDFYCQQINYVFNSQDCELERINKCIQHEVRNKNQQMYKSSFYTFIYVFLFICLFLNIPQFS